MTQIHGQRADDNDNDPVEVRKDQILGGNLFDLLGGLPTSPIWGGGHAFWQYFPRGIIVSSPNSCACVIYGPIYDYWDLTGQFFGYLGFPITDLLTVPTPPSGPGLPPPPPGASYAVFEHGVLYLDPAVGATVQELVPIAPAMVASGANVTPTGDGIAQAAQATIQGFADAALATDQRLADNVERIFTRTSFNSTGPGGCAGAGFDNPGRSLLRSHILNVHFDFFLKGCAGNFGDATADLRVEVRLFINPPAVTARLVRYWIDAVSSPFGAGDNDIRDGLTRSLNGQFGKDLLNRTVPKGITIIGAIVETNGDVNLYMPPICSSSAVLMTSGGPAAGTTLSQLRHLRDQYLVKQPGGRDFVQIMDVFGPALVAAVRDERDARAIHDAMARWLTRAFAESADLGRIAEQLAVMTQDFQRLVSHPALRRDRAWPDRLLRRAIGLVREHLSEDLPLDDILSQARKVIHEEIERCGRDGHDDGSTR